MIQNRIITVFGAYGHTGRFVVSGCPWTAVSSVPWIAINSGANGTASASVTISSDVNLSPVARTGTITITGLQSNLSVSVTQSGLSPAAAIGSVAISGSEQSVPVPGSQSTGSVSIGAYPAGNYYSGTMSVTVNGIVAGSTSFSSGQSGYSIAQYLASSINSNSNSPVTASATGSSTGAVYMTSKTVGSNTNYPFSVSCTVFGGAMLIQLHQQRNDVRRNRPN